MLIIWIWREKYKLNLRQKKELREIQAKCYRRIKKGRIDFFSFNREDFMVEVYWVLKKERDVDK